MQATFYVPPWLHAHSHTRWSSKHTNSSNPQPSGYWRYHNSFFSQRQARKDDRNCTCKPQKTGLNWFRRGKNWVVYFFLPLAKDLGTFDVQSASIFKKESRKEKKEEEKKTHHWKGLAALGPRHAHLKLALGQVHLLMDSRNRGVHTSPPPRLFSVLPLSSS